MMDNTKYYKKKKKEEKKGQTTEFSARIGSSFEELTSYCN